MTLAKALICLLVSLLIHESIAFIPKSICIVSPSGALSGTHKTNLRHTAEFLQLSGYQVSIMPHTTDNWNGFGATDENRLADLQNALLDTQNCAIIWCARGGYGLGRIIDRIDWKRVNEARSIVEKQNPGIVSLKVLGYSDATHLLVSVAAQTKNNYLAIHSPMVGFKDVSDPAMFHNIERLIQGQHGDTLLAKPNLQNRVGVANGKLIGGNLSILVATLGTPTEIQTEGKILFIEDVGESAYHIDRMIHQLGRAGKLHTLKGLVVGEFTDCGNDSYFPAPVSMCEIVRQGAQIYGGSYPIACEFLFGHGAPNFPIPLETTAHLNVTMGGSALTF